MRRNKSSIIETEDVEKDVPDARLYALVDSTKRQYAYRFRAFEYYCEQVNESALPASPDTVLNFLMFQSTRTVPGSVKVFKQAIRNRHIVADLPDPTSTTKISELMSGINRKYGTSVSKRRALSAHRQA